MGITNKEVSNLLLTNNVNNNSTVTYVDFKNKKVINNSYINNTEGNFVTQMEDEELNVYNYHLIQEGYQLMGNFSSENKVLLDNFIDILSMNKVRHTVGLAFDVSNKPLDSYKSLWIDMDSYNKSSLTKKLFFGRKLATHPMDVYDKLKKILGINYGWEI